MITLHSIIDAEVARLERFEHLGGVQHHAAGDHAGHARREHTAGQQRQFVNLVAHHHQPSRTQPGQRGAKGVCLLVRRQLAERQT